MFPLQFPPLGSRLEFLPWHLLMTGVTCKSDKPFLPQLGCISVSSQPQKETRMTRTHFMNCGVLCASQISLIALLTGWADPASRNQECKLAIVSGRTRSLTLLTSCSVHSAPLSPFSCQQSYYFVHHFPEGWKLARDAVRKLDLIADVELKRWGN